MVVTATVDRSMIGLWPLTVTFSSSATEDEQAQNNRQRHTLHRFLQLEVHGVSGTCPKDMAAPFRNAAVTTQLATYAYIARNKALIITWIIAESRPFRLTECLDDGS